MIESITLVVCGGLFGWFLGQLPRKWVYAIAAAAIVLVVLSLKGEMQL